MSNLIDIFFHKNITAKSMGTPLASRYCKLLAKKTNDYSYRIKFTFNVNFCSFRQSQEIIEQENAYKRQSLWANGQLKSAVLFVGFPFGGGGDGGMIVAAVIAAGNHEKYDKSQNDIILKQMLSIMICSK